MKPRVLFVGHTRYDMPLSPSLAKKWEALEAVLKPKVIGALGTGQSVSDPRFRLLRPVAPALRGYYAALLVSLAGEIKRFRPHAIVCESPYEGFCALLATGRFPRRPKLIVEVHGDWRTAARLYGSRWRRLIGPVSDRVATLAVRRADATRAVSAYTAALIEEVTGQVPLAVFPAFIDIESFASSPVKPLPETPTAIWVGVLERYKNADGLERIWKRVAARVAKARLVVIGDGLLRPAIERLAAAHPGRVEYIRRLSSEEVARSLDEATTLLLPSRSEGMPRVIIEAFARGRPVVASAAGGIPDAVVHDRNGLLTPPLDDDAFAEAVIRVLSDPGRARRLADGALQDSARLHWGPSEYADAVRDLIDRTIAGADSRTLTD